jgi:hypothetical protein
MNDLINGTIELIGALLIAYNCLLLYKHKEVQGVSVMTTAFFSAWGVWNLYFYPSNQLWFSFGGGVCLATANLTWVGMAIYYSKKPKRSPPPLPTIAPSKPASVLDRIYAIRGISTVPHPDIEENRRREATLREACYRTHSVETRPWVPGCWNLDDLRRIRAKYRHKCAESEKTDSSSN